MLPALVVILLGCKNNEEQADAYGNFEAIEVMVSAEVQGRILEFNPREGEMLHKDQVVVVVDSTQLNLKKKQLQSGVASLRSKINTLDAQVLASTVQLENMEREKRRIDKLLEGGAATSKQQDDIYGQIALLKAQIVATESQKASVYAERKTLDVQIQQVEDQMALLFSEQYPEARASFNIEISRVHFSEKSPYQKIDILESPFFGIFYFVLCKYFI